MPVSIILYSRQLNGIYVCSS